jgi:hypothetical protein
MTGRGKKSSKQKKFASGVSQHNLLAFGCAGFPSDDSEDSDYQPSDGEQPSTSGRKRGMVLRDQLVHFIDVSLRPCLHYEPKPGLGLPLD